MIHAGHAHRGIRRGFTLIEAIASIVVLSIIGTVASNIIITSADGYFASSTRADLHVDASVTLDRIMRELRSIRQDTTAPAIAPDITQTTGTSILWNDNNGTSELTLTGTNLYLSKDGGPALVLQSGVSQFEVRLCDESDANIGPILNDAACDPIRRIEITLGLTKNAITETLRSRVFLRSTMIGASS